MFLKVVSEFILTEGWVEFKPQGPNGFPYIFLIVSLYKIISKGIWPRFYARLLL